MPLGQSDPGKVSTRMQPGNRPRMEWRLRVIAPKHTQTVLVVFDTVDRNGQDVRLRSWEWVSGRPTPDQLVDLVSTVEDDLQSAIVALIGVQGVFS